MDCKLRFGVSFSGDQCGEPLDGRVLLMISDDGGKEPRFQITKKLDSQLVFGVDVGGLEPGEEVVIDGDVFGYPLEGISEIPRGEYWVQALLHVYETFHRGDGHVVKLPMDRGEGQMWQTAPGNLLSEPVKMRIDPGSDETLHVVMDRKIPSFPERHDTKYVKHIRMQSKLLSEFWGQPWYLEAIILLPEGFDENPEMRYPLMIYHGHHHRMFFAPVQFRETPPDPDLAPEPGGYFTGYNVTEQKYAYKFYKDWTHPDYPRYILMTIQHATPFFDDSYAVNSQNTGPYGDAITYELIPYIEEHYRGIGEGWARVMTGGSTGGWEVLAQQIFYPDEYNGCWAWCPDPVDFRAFTTTNIYEDENAFYYDSRWKKRTLKPQVRTTEGHPVITLKEVCQMEHVMGTKGRSNGEPNNWLTVFNPVGDDGYPRLLWDKLTGEIDREVAEYMLENYDLRHILERDWKELGPKLEGKIRIYIGTMDNLFYTISAQYMQEFLEDTENPYYGGTFEWGDRFGHCWSGDHVNPYPNSRLTVNQRFIGEMMERIVASAPPGADTSWKGDWPIHSRVDYREWRAQKIPGWHADKDKREPE